VSGGRTERAIAAFLRQEFGASVAAIDGFVEILIEDARQHELTDLLPDLDRMRQAGEQLGELIDRAAESLQEGGTEAARLRHDLRTPLNAIKGYGELLVEEARDSGRDALLEDLGKVLDLADRLLGEIDHVVEIAAAPPIELVGNVLQTIRPLADLNVSNLGTVGSRILVVDDNAANRDLLARRLGREGYCVTVAASGAEALALAAGESFDLVLLDLMMPGMSGFEVLCRLKADAGSRHIPVIMISALDELDSTVRCIEAGAEDYLPKPFNPVLLRARIGSSLEKKRLLDELRVEKERSEALLRNILPLPIIERMRRGETVIADRIGEVTVLFADLADFTALSAMLAPEETVRLLGRLFLQFDDLAVRHGVQAIKTIGDGYMATAGILDEEPAKAAAMAEMALSMLDVTDAISKDLDVRLLLRIGINTGGPIVAGVLGARKIAYDVWGDAVNTAKRMETYGLPGRVHVSAATRQALGDAFHFEPRGSLEVKGKGKVETYFLYRP
jgi:adenylate cyclase